MNAVDLAERVIARLSDPGGAPCYPWVLVGQAIFSPDELASLDDEAILARWPHSYTGSTVKYLAWNARHLSDMPDAARYLLGKRWARPDHTPPVLLFWPPRHEGGAPSLVYWWGKEEEVFALLNWLINQPLPAYRGARETLYETILSANAEPIELTPIPLEGSYADG